MGMVCSCTSCGAVLETNSKVGDRAVSRVDWSERHVNDAKAEYLAGLLMANGGVQSVLLGWVGISRYGLRSVCDAVGVHKGLSTLVLSGNGIRDVEPVAAMLKANRSLTYLNMSGNEVEEGGFRQLLGALRDNTTLKVLSLGGNNIKTTDASIIIDHLGPTPSLLLLDLQDNPIPPDILKKLHFSFTRPLPPSLNTIPSPPPSATLPPCPLPPPRSSSPLSSISTDTSSSSLSDVMNTPPFALEFTPTSGPSWEMTRNSPLQLDIDDITPEKVAV
eukprot:TRINITY_DN19792_c0_g1_i1.p1 TRINITY_DN19792_c0_g1~~TRINITY_DN19792_c0_g1_i1.p1  ORF type:complete len:288 (+),score=54.50 TRINITY_DN19792_c0_g1_i1:40-864(+)